jgi:hypothetical protein
MAYSGRFPAALLAVGLAACSSGGGGGGGMGGTGNGGSSGTGGFVATGSSLAGIWDGTGTRDGENPASVTITIDADRLVIEHPSAVLRAVRAGDHFDVEWQLSDVGGVTTTSFRAVHTPSVKSSGALPLSPYGEWRLDEPIADPAYGCELSVDDVAMGECKRTGTPDLLPVWFPNPQNELVTAQQIMKQPSIFGDLGGKWQVNQPVGKLCTFDLTANTIDITCGGSKMTAGSLHVDVNGDVISGFTNRGIEFTAQRR